MQRDIRIAALLVAFAVQVCTCAHSLEEKYQFSAILDDGYTLYWNFDLEQQTIAFAVNVSTTGWVGFGLSPNGQMPQSDVVIGWVDNNGNTQFHDRFAVDRFLPPIDESQDWFLVSGEEENGYTILEFTRSFTTCDEYDLDIQADTARVIWAYHTLDPNSIDSLANLQHEEMGSISLNLLGGNNEVRVEQDSDFFIINNDNFVIPESDTTYWCRAQYLPENVRQQERYIYKFGPALSEVSKQYVHHVVVYLCSNLNDTHVGTGIECTDVTERHPIALCRTETVIAAWAVGGQDFVFPQDVAFPIGGVGNTDIIVLEMHYDNPNGDVGVVDSSGLKFTFTSEPSRYRAGILSFFHSSTNFLVIPPGRDNYIINAMCSDGCTQKFFPPGGITVFGNMLHTHLAGHGLIVRHFRQNEQCDVLEELEPIDENRRYDFNYQQVTILPREVQVLPGDSLLLQCFYRTADINNVTLGGESTRNEMCVSFLMYYPELNVSSCGSQATFVSYFNFAQQHIPQSQHEAFFNSLGGLDGDATQVILDKVEWTDEAVSMIQQLTESAGTSYCLDSKNISNSIIYDVPFPSSDCPYEATDKCGDTQPLSCCERLSMSSGVVTQAGYKLVLFGALLCIITRVIAMV